MRLTNTKENRKGQEPFEYWLKDNHPLGQIKAIERLAEYEDAEDKGMLLKLPFLPKPGMKLYDIYGVIENGEAEPREITVRSFNITHARMWYFHINNEVFTFDDFGKTYFLSREEAKAALAEIRSTEGQRSTETNQMSR